MKISPEYQAALDYLFSYVDFSMTKGLVFTPETFSLAPMRALLDALQNPQISYPVIHIAGSKGKGSTAAMVASILQQAGYRVGLYTSPHMIDFNERIQINGNPISHEAFVDLLESNKPVIESIEKITTFEVATALAFDYFRLEAVDIAVIEVGLGGRLDATNLVQPLLTVISSISLDHTAILGDTLEKIATEKAGIMKSGIPVVLAHQVPGVMQHLQVVAVERGCEAFVTDEFVQAQIQMSDLYHQEVLFSLKKELPWQTGVAIKQTWQVSLPLVGQHQIENASTVLLIAFWLMDHGIHISVQHMLEGFKKTIWPGRFEIVSKEPLMIVDSAHNPDSALRLKTTMGELLPGKTIKMIFGASEDKNVEEMLALLKESVQHFIFTESIHPRAMQVSQLESIAKRLELSYEICCPLENAVSSQQATLQKNEVCIATGSIFIAGAVKEELNAWKLTQAD